MTATPVIDDSLVQAPIALDFATLLQWDAERFYEFCQANRELRIEREAQGTVIIMAPAGAESSAANADLTMQLRVWALKEGSGVVFDSSGGFALPDGAVRSPDVSWVRRSRLAPLSASQRARFLPLCPDFVIELRSPTDRLVDLHDKMSEYMANGASHGLLIDPLARVLQVYGPEGLQATLRAPATWTAAADMPGLTLDLAGIWEPGW